LEEDEPETAPGGATGVSSFRPKLIMELLM